MYEHGFDSCATGGHPPARRCVVVHETSLPRNTGYGCLQTCSPSLLYCCNSVFLLGFVISRIRLLFLKQRSCVKLVQLNRKFSIEFTVFMSDGLFWH